MTKEEEIQAIKAENKAYRDALQSIIDLTDPGFMATYSQEFCLSGDVNIYHAIMARIRANADIALLYKGEE